MNRSRLLVFHLGLTAIFIGYLTVWLPNELAGLAFLGVEIGEWVKFLPAVQAARDYGLTTIALTGPEGGRLRSLADLAIPTPAGTIEQVEDIHLAIAHSLCVTLRQQLAEEAAAPPLLREQDLTASLV